MKVLDEEKVLAFMDINPACHGHMLVVPKNHAENIFEISETDLSAVMDVVKRCAAAVREAVGAEGITVLELNGTASDQLVPHLHVHLMPRWKDDGMSVSQWEMGKGDIKELQKHARKVQKCFS